MLFKIKYIYFKYQVILLGLFNTLISFSDYISKILAKKRDVFAMIEFDNFLIYMNEVNNIDLI